MKVAIILGTRPEIIKMSPVIRACERAGLDYFILHTGQHYSYNMDAVFFSQLRLPGARYNLNVGSGSHAEETGRMLIGMEKPLKEEKPDIALVQGDTNTVLAGALAAVKLGIRLGHVEAGLRSYDRTMPEEINRVTADHVSDLLFAPTETARANLAREGIEKGVFVTGNTVVDAVRQNLRLAEESGAGAGLMDPEGYFLMTMHRQENVDNPERLASILKGLDLVSGKFGKKIIYPMHPRTRKRLREFGITVKTGNIAITEPVDYLSFLRLECGAGLIFTDSGGVQEEACILKVPCVTLRYNTERPETVEAGANMLAGTSPEKILECAGMMLDRDRSWVNPFGDGKSGERITEIISSS